MIQDRLAQIEAKLASASDVPSPTREELQALLAELRTEVATLSPPDAAKAETIATSADAAIARVLEPTPAVLDELKASVEGFEASHPRLVQVVDRIALTLSNMGI